MELYEETGLKKYILANNEMSQNLLSLIYSNELNLKILIKLIKISLLKIITSFVKLISEDQQ